MTLRIPGGHAPLPAGYRYGRIVTSPARNGYYVIRESDNASTIGWLSPEAEAPTADEIDDAIDAEVSR